MSRHLRFDTGCEAPWLFVPRFSAIAQASVTWSRRKAESIFQKAKFILLTLTLCFVRWDSKFQQPENFDPAASLIKVLCK
jgi:hypothetical protein